MHPSVGYRAPRVSMRGHPPYRANREPRPDATTNSGTSSVSALTLHMPRSRAVPGSPLPRSSVALAGGRDLGVCAQVVFSGAWHFFSGAWHFAKAYKS